MPSQRANSRGTSSGGTGSRRGGQQATQRPESAPATEDKWSRYNEQLAAKKEEHQRGRSSAADGSGASCPVPYHRSWDKNHTTQNHGWTQRSGWKIPVHQGRPVSPTGSVASSVASSARTTGSFATRTQRSDGLREQRSELAVERDVRWNVKKQRWFEFLPEHLRALAKFSIVPIEDYDLSFEALTQRLPSYKLNIDCEAANARKLRTQNELLRYYVQGHLRLQEVNGERIFWERGKIIERIEGDPSTAYFQRRGLHTGGGALDRTPSPTAADIAAGAPYKWPGSCWRGKHERGIGVGGHNIKNLADLRTREHLRDIGWQDTDEEYSSDGSDIEHALNTDLNFLPAPRTRASPEPPADSGASCPPVTIPEPACQPARSKVVTKKVERSKIRDPSEAPSASTARSSCSSWRDCGEQGAISSEEEYCVTETVRAPPRSAHSCVPRTASRQRR